MPFLNNDHLSFKTTFLSSLLRPNLQSDTYSSTSAQLTTSSKNEEMQETYQKQLFLSFVLSFVILLIFNMCSRFFVQKAMAGIKRINLDGLRWRVFDARGQVLSMFLSSLAFQSTLFPISFFWLGFIF